METKKKNENFLYAVTSVIKVNLFANHIKANIESNFFLQPDFSGFLDILCKDVKKKQASVGEKKCVKRYAWSRRGDSNLPNNYFSYNKRDTEDWSPAPVPAASSPHCSCMQTKCMTSLHIHVFSKQRFFFFFFSCADSTSSWCSCWMFSHSSSQQWIVFNCIWKLRNCYDII